MPSLDRPFLPRCQIAERRSQMAVQLDMERLPARGDEDNVIFAVP